MGIEETNASPAVERTPEYTPTTGEVQRAWMMRQSDLDREAGREPDPLTYDREFIRWLRGHEAKFQTEIDRLRAQLTANRAHDATP